MTPTKPHHHQTHQQGDGYVRRHRAEPVSSTRGSIWNTPIGIEKDIRYNATDALLLACHLRARGMTDIQITNQHGDDVDEVGLVISLSPKSHSN